MTIPSNPDALLRRKATADALTEKGYPTSEKTLATQASRGNGPPHSPLRQVSAVPVG